MNRRSDLPLRSADTSPEVGVAERGVLEQDQVTSIDVLARHPLPLAGSLALATLPLHLVLPHALSVTLASTVLALIGGIYVGFALLDGRPVVLARECAVAVAFVLFATASAGFAPQLLPFGYIAHGLWDIAHRSHGLELAMPRGYVPLCALYDVLAGIGLWSIWSL